MVQRERKGENKKKCNKKEKKKRKKKGGGGTKAAATQRTRRELKSKAKNLRARLCWTMEKREKIHQEGNKKPTATWELADPVHYKGKGKGN